MAVLAIPTGSRYFEIDVWLAVGSFTGAATLFGRLGVIACGLSKRLSNRYRVRKRTGGGEHAIATETATK